MSLFIDIETLSQAPEAFMVPDVDKMEPPANYKKADSIAKWREEQAAELLPELTRKSSLEPLLGGIVLCVGIAVDDQPVKVLVGGGTEADELKLLQTLEKGLLRYTGVPMVGWRGCGFDFPFLAKRALRHGLYSLARQCFLSKPWGDPVHVDPQRVWQMGDNRAIGRMKQVAQFLGIEVNDDLDGSEVADAFHRGELARIVEHCRSDVTLLREVYWRMRTAGWILGDDKVPDDLPVRPPRVDERQALMAEAAELQIATEKSRAQVAAEEAGISWVGMPPYEDGPQIDESTTADQIRTFVAALRRAA